MHGEVNHDCMFNAVYNNYEMQFHIKVIQNLSIVIIIWVFQL